MCYKTWPNHFPWLVTFPKLKTPVRSIIQPLGRSETQIALSSIRTRVADSTSYDDKRCAKRDSIYVITKFLRQELNGKPGEFLNGLELVWIQSSFAYTVLTSKYCWLLENGSVMGNVLLFSEHLQSPGSVEHYTNVDGNKLDFWKFNILLNILAKASSRPLLDASQYCLRCRKP